MNNNEIAICHLPLSESKEEVLKMIKNDPELEHSINEKKLTLEKQEIEIFYCLHNLIVTESGYYIALFTKDLIVNNENY